MIEDIIILIGGIVILSYILFRIIRVQWYNILITKKMSGQDISKLTGNSGFDEQITALLNNVIHKYELYKQKITENQKEKDNNNMYQ